ncbi:MAG: toll/interleukin-1 receptor domain-containing protein, partial [Pseudomonadales bacterium]|nr:toll/interleukin-1 receptor domain-containing protein [Pseudomonadales bacterium]
VVFDEKKKKKKEFEIRDIYESASIVWVDTRRCDFGEGFTDRVVGTINWDVQPRADSFSLLLRVENFYRGRKNDGYISSYLSEDYRQFREYNYIKTSKVLSELAFSLCVECLDCVGAIKRFPKGSKSVDETVCLNTSIMLHYMQAMFSAASDDKIGRLAEEQCYAGDFVISDNFKIDDRLQEVCLVSSILSLLEDMNLIYSMCSGEGAFWMFPSESEVIEYDGEGELITTTSFEIDGSVKDAYSYSVTKLFGSVIFHDPLLYKNLAIFSSIGGGQCGIKYRAVSPESGELLLCFTENSSANTIEIFTSFVKKNLDDATFINRISEKELVPSNQLASINSQAVEHRGSVDRGTDLFICYNSKDFENVRFIAKELELRDVNVWYDRRLLPGDSVQSVLAKQLREAKAVLILLGADGLGAWQNIEINLVLQQAVECNVRVIPGILPNFTDPSPPGFLNTYQYVDFRVLSANPIDEIANVIFTDCNNENQLKSERQVISLPNERT